MKTSVSPFVMLNGARERTSGLQRSGISHGASSFFWRLGTPFWEGLKKPHFFGILLPNKGPWPRPFLPLLLDLTFVRFKNKSLGCVTERDKPKKHHSAPLRVVRCFPAGQWLELPYEPYSTTDKSLVVGMTTRVGPDYSRRRRAPSRSMYACMHV